MPLYEYKCPCCPNEEERYSSIADRKHQPCSACHQPMDLKVSKVAILGKTKDSNGIEEVPVGDFDMEGTEKAIWKGMHADAQSNE